MCRRQYEYKYHLGHWRSGNNTLGLASAFSAFV